ncbi:hypothetical protein F5Y06DRAFT_256563 [Hypoxylon sp. FL0890]|nr:hypothetical protein F5Y06DRAFT_256563 [Hypoxylon sp. FL0890]
MLKMEVDSQVSHSTGLSNFPQFSRLPKKVRSKIWKAALPERKAGFILLSCRVQILQAPPVIYHVCRQSRKIALKKGEGRIYQLEDGRRTYFCKETDFFLWGGFKLGLGELAGVIQNVVIPRCMFVDYSQACETFEILLTDGDFEQLQNIYVNLENRFTVLNLGSNSAAESHLFQSDTIVIPDLNWYEAKMRSIDDIATLLPGHVAAHWAEHREIAFDDDDVHEWKSFGGDVKYALMSTMVRLSGSVSDEQYDDFEAETMMHSSGVSWWDFAAHNSPDIWPTYLFTRIPESQRVDGVIQGDDLLSRTLEEF